MAKHERIGRNTVSNYWDEDSGGSSKALLR